jgi:hypothetical protein
MTTKPKKTQRSKPIHPEFRARIAHDAMGLNIVSTGPRTPETIAAHEKAIKEREAEWERKFGPAAMPALIAEYERELAEWEAENPEDG